MGTTARIPLSAMTAACILASPLCLAQADVQPLPAPEWRLGDSLEYSSRFLTVKCSKWTVTSLDKGGEAMMECGENVAFMEKESGNVTRILTKAGDKVAQFKPSLPALQFPLAPGKSWSGNYSGYTDDDGANWTASRTCQVKGYEQVKVAAGTFNALRIDCKDDWSSPPFKGVSSTTSWYAPDVQAVVKAENSQDPKWNMELKAFSRR